MKRTLTLVVLLSATLMAGATETWWGLWNTGLGLVERSQLYSGRNNLYVRLTAQNSPQLVGGQISGLRFWLSDKSDVKSATVWISTADIEGREPNIMSLTLQPTDLRDLAHDQSPTEVTFSQPYDVLPAGNRYANVYVGYTLELADNPSTALMASAGKGSAYANFYNGTDIAGNYGSLALQVRIAGPNLPAFAATPASVSARQIQEKGHQAVCQLPVATSGSQAVSSVDYVVSIDGQPQPPQHYDLPAAVDELGRLFTLPAAYTLPAASGEYALTVQLTQVNGQPNEGATTTADAALVVLDSQPLKRAVMEEFTGTWCLNCVRGIAGVRLLQDAFGQQFIPIAMHSDDPALDRDPMIVSHYRNSTFYKGKSAILGGLPSCTIDRYIDGDPYCGYNTSGAFQTDQLVAQALSRPAVADVGVQASWADDGQSAVDVHVATTFAYDSPQCPFRLILVLTADSLTGEGDRWRQRNGYNDYTGDDPALLAYAGLGAYLPERVYNHVAIDIAGVNDGIDGSLTAPLVSGAAQHFAYQFSTAQNPLVQDKTRLAVVAMVYDTRDQSVVNAATATVSNSTAVTAVESLSRGPHTIYTLSGQRVTSVSRQGLYIVDGQLRRVAP